MSHFRGYLAQPETDLHQSNNSNSSSSSSTSSFSDSSDSSTILAPRQPTRTVDDRRCWICFGDSSDSQGQWIKPCQCSLEAHQSCLLDWIAENQKATPNKTVGRDNQFKLFFLI